MGKKMIPWIYIILCLNIRTIKGSHSFKHWNSRPIIVLNIGIVLEMMLYQKDEGKRLMLKKWPLIVPGLLCRVSCIMSTFYMG